MAKFLIVDPICIMGKSDWNHVNVIGDQLCDEQAEAQMTAIEQTKYETACEDQAFKNFFMTLSANVTVGSIFSNYLAYVTSIKNHSPQVQVEGPAFYLRNNYLIAKLTPALLNYIEQVGPKTSTLTKLNVLTNKSTSLLDTLVQGHCAQLLTVPDNQSSFSLTIPADGETRTWDNKQLVSDKTVTIQCA
ncbi:hypothetical protein ACFP3T_13525 [Lactiplantibacillus dongliensis]|uniref:Uncharacterized protein n=1 Tax=Lactiplantibacillus dongliensis TaxID=2559919 RepID=A0ABW1R939_9LACO|nr:hypothetical protein [Lactiplantibacillus dongliensis]